MPVKVEGDKMSNIKVNLDSLKPSREIVRHKIKEGVSVFRVLPPFGETANGYPYRRWPLVWLTDPQTGTRRPYVSPFGTEKRCPFTEYTKELQAKAERMKVEGASKEDLRKINEQIALFRPKTIFLYNASDKNGNVGILELKATAHDALKKLMGEYIQEYSQDPTSLNNAPDDSGVWFKFTRSGKGFDTKYAVEKEQTKVKEGTRILFEDDRSPLPEHVMKNYEQLAYDIHNIYTVRSYDECKDILLANIRAYEAGTLGNTNGASGAGSAGSNGGGFTANTVAAQPAAPQRVGLKLDAEPAAASDDEDVYAMADRLLNN